MCHKFTNCCHASPVGARFLQFWQKWAALGVNPKVVTVLKEGYTLPVPAKLDKVTKGHKLLCKSPQEPLPVGGIASAYGQKSSRTGNKSNISGLLQPVIFGSQTQQPVETYTGPEQLKQVSKDRVIQNGDPRDSKDLPTSRGVGDLNRLQGCILPYTHPEPVKEVPAFPCTGQFIPVQSTTIRPLHSSHGVHCSGQRDQVSCFAKGYKDPPVPRRLTVVAKEIKFLALQRGIRIHQYLDDWLVRARSQQICLPTYTDLSSSLSGTGMASEHRKIRTGPSTGFQLCRLPVRFERGQVQTHPRSLADPTDKNKGSRVRSGVFGLENNVPDRL